MQINGTTKILGLFGKPVKHSFSPFMHNAAINELGLNYIYLPFHVEDNIKTSVQAIKSLGFRGVNVTVPYKETVIPFLDELTPEAKNIGAVNTIINENGKLIGDNTDGRGFVRSLNENLNFDINNSTIFIIGAGGAARAIVVSLIFAGAKQIFIADSTKEKAEKIAILNNKITAIEIKEIKQTIKQSNLIINATPCGMEKDITPFNLNFLNKNNTVYDIVYNRETPLVKHCKEQNIPVINGLMMLLYQGVISFEKWTGKNAPVNIMREMLISKIK